MYLNGQRRPIGVSRVVRSTETGYRGMGGTSMFTLSHTLALYMGAAGGWATATTTQELETACTVAEVCLPAPLGTEWRKKWDG